MPLSVILNESIGAVSSLKKSTARSISIVMRPWIVSGRFASLIAWNEFITASKGLPLGQDRLADVVAEVDLDGHAGIGWGEAVARGIVVELLENAKQ